MLANGATIGYRDTGGSGDFTEIPGLKELPDLGAEPELVDNTALGDSYRHNEMGIGDPGSMEYVFRYDNSGKGTSYRVAKSLDGQTKEFQTKLKDGTAFVYTATVALRVSGGGVNDPIEFVMAHALQSDITITDPA